MLTDNKRIIALISGSGSNLQALIDACDSGRINGRIVSVFSNQPDAFGLRRAQNNNIPAQTIDHTRYTLRTEFDEALMTAIDQQQPDLVLLAGFMRILTPAFVQHYQGRLLNIHPSLLPAYKGVNTHQRVLDDGGRQHGASVHFVTAELDGGPVILQAEVPVQQDDDARSLARRVLQQEHIIYPQVMEWFCAGRLQLDRKQRVVFDGKLLDAPMKLAAPAGIEPTTAP